MEENFTSKQYTLLIHINAFFKIPDKNQHPEVFILGS